jgi:hypothetical protein
LGSGQGFHTQAFLVVTYPSDLVEVAFQGADAQTKVQWAATGLATGKLYRAGPHLVCSEAQAAAYLAGTRGVILTQGGYTLESLNLLGFQDSYVSPAPVTEAAGHEV